MAERQGGTCYLLHFDRPFGHARHYLGWASNLDARLRHHEEGTGANLLKHARAAGVTWTLARTWTGDRHLERRMHNGGHARRCPVCKEWARTSREVLDVLVDGVHTGGSPIQIGDHAMANVSSFDVEDTDFVRSIRIHSEWHAVGLNDGSHLPETIDPPEQCDGCGSTVSEDEENNLALTLHRLHAGNAWPLRLNEQGAYECTRPACGRIYRVHLHVVKDTVL